MYESAFRWRFAVTKPAAADHATLVKEVARLRDELTKAKMQLLMAQDDLRHQARAGAPNLLVLALQAEIKTLKGQLAHAKSQTAPPSEREVKMRETIRKLGSRLRNAAKKPPKGTLIMSRRDKLKIIKCLHPDKRSAIDERQMTEAAQIFNGLSIRES